MIVAFGLLLLLAYLLGVRALGRGGGVVAVGDEDFRVVPAAGGDGEDVGVEEGGLEHVERE